MERSYRVLIHPVHALPYALWFLGNLRRRLKNPPDYVVFTLEGAYPELRAPRPGFFQRRLFQGATLSLQELGEQFRAVQQDPRITGVVLHLRGLTLPAAHTQTIREFIVQLRSSGKRVIAWSTSYDNTRYYIATAANEILLQNGGGASPRGLRATFVFLADALKRAGMKADFIQISPYKSAADPLMRSNMSDEVRDMANWLLDAYYDDFIQALASGRGLEEQAAKDLVDGAPYTDLQALGSGVVDRLISEEDLPSYLAIKGKPARFATWATARRRVLRPLSALPGRYVALIRVEGVIISGRSQRPPGKSPVPLPFVFNPRAGDMSVVQQARVALMDRRAAAVVLYVNSEGGSALASEAMAAALEKLAAKKPLIASMGPVAASGGYYVCTPAQWILAQPGTLTGSIGVLAGKLIIGGLWDKLLFHRESIGRGRHSDFDSVERPFNDEERQSVTDDIQRVYDVFLDRVTSSRNISLEAANAVAGGRVWTGRQAKEHGLVDQLGGLENALAKARQLAGLNPRAPVHEIVISREHNYPPLPDPAAMIRYPVESINVLRGGEALCLSDLLMLEAHSDA